MKYIAAFLVTLITLSADFAAANVVNLRTDITIDGDTVTFGDIFEGAGDKTDYVIANAPAPGKSTTFKATSVAFVARKHGLDWRPTRPIQRVTVSRAGVAVPQQLIAEEIRFTLQEELGTDMFDMALSTQHPNINVSPSEATSVAVESLSYSRQKGSFVATVLAPANAETGRRYKISGNVHALIEVPVLSRHLPTGAKITEADITYKTIRKDQLGRATVADASVLIGKSPIRNIRPDTPINIRNLGDPVTVEKGKLVAVLFRQGGIALSVTGRTLENGGEGEIIRVENIASRKIIQAEVINSQEVRIITAQQRLANLQ
ncbi:flagellar basal body P-ring formation chaperone FlgA [Sneathiella chinensis]|uniref:Flagellar basal body P-ring biosynthesis protein FlgA n=1 Tax=Sneathiella chinensis TaxID=349750 RepID=A0ABQ5U5K8_9PROT|nr:flagellar basal body P-ring formation chaperone FlgA [Sneathiella chinensis]GLQ07402.1 flagellar basal body P-ring biosynthesis protein FlgA [Sneathiella chinensis]